MKKNFVTLMMMASAVVCVAQEVKTSPTNERYNLEALGMSSNFRYISGLNVSTYSGFVWNTETNAVVENEGDYANCDFRACTDDGRAVGILGLDDMVTTNAAMFDQTGKVTIIEDSMSVAFACTPDGSMIVGALLDEMWLPTPCLWKNGERIILPYPSLAECGIDNDGANAQFISADGSVIAGYLQDWMSSRPAIIWRRQQDGSYKYDVISKDIWGPRWGSGKPYLKFECLGISADGKWLAIVAQKEAAEEGMPTPEYMVRMNLETGEIFEAETPAIAYFNPETDNMYPNSIANDGTCVGSCMDEIGYIRGVIWRAGETKPQLLADLFPQFPEQFASYDNFMHFPIGISKDANIIGGYGILITTDALGESDMNYQSYRLVIDPATGIANVHTDNLPVSSRYTLNGTPATANHKGITLSSGRKYIIK